MKLHLLYFGIVRERLGRRDETRECADGSTVGQLLAELSGTHGIFALGAGVIRIAVNREYVGEEHVLADNDEVAVIPPVAGGVDDRHAASVVPPEPAGAFAPAKSSLRCGVAGTNAPAGSRCARRRLGISAWKRGTWA